MAGLVVSALTAIFLVSCVDMWDAYSQPGAGANSAGAWPGLAGLANSSASVQAPVNLLPQALAVPLALGGAGTGAQ